MLLGRLRVSFLSCGLLLLASAVPLRAQSPGHLDGTVADSTEAAIPGAEVTLTNSATGVVSKTTSNSTGQYVFSFVLPGSYDLSATQAGFKKWARVVVVHANDHLAVKIALEVGAATEQMEVTATSLAVPTVDSGQRSETLTSEQIQAYSTESPDAEELLKLLPGITVNGAPGYSTQFNPRVVSSGNNGIEGFNVNGNRSDANTFKLDGGNMNDLTGNNGSNIYPNTEFISELTVETSNFTADQGGSPILVTAITKSGSKDFHGEAFWSGRNYAFDANEWSNNFQGTKRPASKFNYPGFSIGGPILLPGTDYNRGKEKKLFFFLGANWSRQLPDGGTQLGDVPTQPELTGNFSDIVLSPTCIAARALADGSVDNTFYLNQPCQITDPATGLTLDQQGGQLTGVTANGTGLLKSLQGPNLIGPNYTDPLGLWNFSGHPLYPQNVTQYVARFDWDPSEKARIFVRLGKQDETQFSPWSEYSGIGSTWTSSVPDPTPTIQEYHSRSLNINMVSVLSPTLTNEFVFNANVLRQPNHYQNPNILSKASLGVSFNGIFPGSTYPLVPQILDNFAQCSSAVTIGCGSAGAGEGEGPGQGRWGASNLVGAGNYYKQTQFEFGDSLTKVVKSHTLKFGALVGRARNDQNLSGDALEGALVTSNWGAQTTGDEYADLLLEHVTEYEQASNDVRGNLRSSIFEWYGQDNWKVNKKLTLEFGMRWTWQGPWYEARGLGSTFDPSAYTVANSSSVYDGVRTASCKNPGQSDVPLCGTIPKTILPYGHPVTQPRLGFSWDVFGTGRAVLRGGVGQYTQRDPTNSGFGAIVGPPNVFYAATSNSFAGFTSLSQIENSSPGAQPSFTYGESNPVYSPTDTHLAAIYQYNLTVSSALPQHLFAELGYVGSQSRHLSIEQNIDSIPYGALWIPGTHVLQPNLQDVENAVTPYAPFTQIAQVQHEGNANYHGLQATLRRQGSKSIDFIASYTYSKALGDSDNFQTLLPNPFSVKGSRHVLTFDRTHTFSIGYQYHVPSGARGALAHSSVARAALSGWDLTGITRATSGGPIAITASVHCVQLDSTGAAQDCPNPDPLWDNTATWFGTNAWSYGFLPGANAGTPNGIYPAYTCDPKAHHGGVGTSFININCVALPAFGQQGSIDPPYIKTPGVFTSDLAIQKVFKLGESRRLNIRISSFNFLNRAQLNVPNTVAQFDWTLPFGATDPIQGVPSLTNGGTCDKLGQLGYSCQKTGHREMEASVKFFF